MNNPLPKYIVQNYPFKSNFLKLNDGNRMHYIDEGSGEVLVFAHGNPTWSFLYRKFIAYFSQIGYRTLAMDHIGFGLSDKPRNKDYYTLEKHINNYTQLIDHLKLKDLTLVMQDWGGPISLGYATRFPSNVKRLVILNTWSFVKSMSIPIPRWFSLLMAQGIGEFVYGHLNSFVNIMLPILGTTRKIPPDIMSAYRYPFLDPLSRTGIIQFPRMIPDNLQHPSGETMFQIEKGLAELVNKKAVLIWANKDLAFSLDIAKHMKKLLPNAIGPIIVENAGHFLQEDAPNVIIWHMDNFLNN